MRIDGVSPIPLRSRSPLPAGSQPVHGRRPRGQGSCGDASKPDVSSTNVVVEMQPGNVVIYKFIDAASGA